MTIMHKLYVASAALLAGTALAMTPALAAESKTKQPDLARQVQMLQDQLRAMQQQLDSMKSSEAATREAVANEKTMREAEAKERAEKELAAKEQAIKDGAKTIIVNGKAVLQPAPLPKVVEPANHRFQLSSADGAWTIAPTGRVHFDVGGYLSQKPETANTLGTGDNRLTSGVNVRRGRFGVTGKAMNDFTYTFILDGGGATDNATLINTAQLSYTGFKNTSIDFGYFAQYAILEEASSSNDILFIERSTPTTLASSFGAGDPRFGFGVRNWGPRYFVAAYVTGSRPGDTHQNTFRNWNAYGRASYQLVQEDTQTVHLGGTIITTLQVPNGGPGTARSLTFSDRPELRIDPTNFINTGALGTVANPVKSAQVYGVETAATYGSFFYQGEYFHTEVSRDGRAKAKFDGAYAEVAYAWGGRRTYTANCGCYGGINPISPFSLSGGGTGAWEVAARISYADFTDLYNSSLATAAQIPGFVNGGRQTNYTLALNWFLNANMMFKVNYIHSNLNKANANAKTGIPAGISMDALAGRVQFVF
jgi:phosphate-selective porin OprO/OprP